MITLSNLGDRIITMPSRIECCEMRLLSEYGSEHPIFNGYGYIDIDSLASINFTMFARPNNVDDTLMRLKKLKDDPHGISNRFRLRVLDHQGVKWKCGLTSPRLMRAPQAVFPLTGKLERVTTAVGGPLVATEASVELVFQPKLELPMSSRMVTTTTIDGEEIERKHTAGRETLHVLGSDICIFYTPSDVGLWITATTCTSLRHPYLEQWLSEPLRIILGQLVYPRLRARNFGNGQAFVSFLPVPTRFRKSRIAALLKDIHLVQSQDFWNLYSNLLTLIVSARNDDGQPNLAPHPLTRYYEEVIQATQGSRWVLCMTLASSIEGLLRLLESKPRGTLSIENRLKDLEKQGVTTKRARVSWSKVRNVVMHGQLVSPWSTKDNDERILDLADLFHVLTRELLRQASAK